MIVWGGATNEGQTNTGARCDPRSGSWIATTTASAPRSEHVVVWSGTEMIVWGGRIRL
jgi:hypothetical protein